MRKAIDIYDDACTEVLKDGNQSLKNMALLGIEKAQKEMFHFLYDKAMLDENKSLSLEDFFDKMDGEILFQYAD